MRKRERAPIRATLRALGVLTSVFAGSAGAHAAPAPGASVLVPRPADAGVDARAAADAGRRDAAVDHPGPVKGDEPLPPGHPSMPSAASGSGNFDDSDDDGDLQPGANPHAGGGSGDPAGAGAGGRDPHQGGAGMYRPPEDGAGEDASLPPGSIAVEIRDADDKPIPDVDVTLGILQQSVAKGENRKHVNQRTDGVGAARFDGLETGVGFAYRVSVPKDGASFAATPFQLPQAKAGMRVKLHVFPVTSDIELALVVMQGTIYVELKDDRIQLEQAINVYNFGKAAWVPSDLVMTLPPDFTALTSQESMSDQGIDPVEKRGARLRGTFGPGQHTLVFRWQLPYAGESTADIRVGLPPHLAQARVMAGASQDMQLRVDGFPQAKPNADMQGGRLLETEKEMQRGEAPLRELTISLRDIPTPGPARFVATGLAALGVLFGIGYAYQSRGRRRVIPKDDAKRARQQLLFELEELERAHRAGDVGPKTYERARRELVDAIARTLVS